MSKYCVVQFVPDEISDERVNVGVIAFDDVSVSAQFLTNWQRVKAFAGRNIDAIRLTVDEMRVAVEDVAGLGYPDQKPMTTERIQELIAEWDGSIRLHGPFGSVAPVDELATDMAAVFLKKAVHERRTYRDKKKAGQIVRTELYEVLKKKIAPVALREVWKGSASLAGRDWFQHNFDAVVSNGTPEAAAQAVSFEVPEGSLLERALRDISFSIVDTQASVSTIRHGVFVLPPKKGAPKAIRELHVKAIDKFESNGATILTEQNVAAWFNPVVDELVSKHKEWARDKVEP